MKCAAETLAAQVEGGAFEALTVDQRFDMRCLSMTMAGWSHLLATLEAAETARDRRRTDWRLALAGLMIWTVIGAALAVAGLSLALR